VAGGTQWVMLSIVVADHTPATIAKSDGLSLLLNYGGFTPLRAT